MNAHKILRKKKKKTSRNESAHLRATEYKAQSLCAASTFQQNNTLTPNIQLTPLCPCGGGCPRCATGLPVQAKLKIGSPGDKYEQEADRVADEMMRMGEPGLRTFDGGGKTIQTKKESGQSIGDVTGYASQSIISGGAGRPLSESTRSFFEPRFGGHDLSGVCIYSDTRASESARILNASAFTYGRDIYFGEGKYRPDTTEGKHLLAHELAHVAQQSGRGKRSHEIDITPHENANILQQKAKGKKKRHKRRFRGTSLYKGTTEKKIEETIAALIKNEISSDLVEVNKRVEEQIVTARKYEAEPVGLSEKEKIMWPRNKAPRKKEETSKFRVTQEAEKAAPKTLDLRLLIDGLTAKKLSVSKEKAKNIRAYFHRRLNYVSPYYTQLRNLNILNRGGQAWTRTCNMTSLAMVLGGMETTPSNFKGDREKLKNIRAWFAKRAKGKDRVPKLKNIRRLPDFLQLVAVYLYMPKTKAYKNKRKLHKAVRRAKKTAAYKITHSFEVFSKIASLFGWKQVRIDKTSTFDQVKSQGLTKRKTQNMINKINKITKKLTKKFYKNKGVNTKVVRRRIIPISKGGKSLTDKDKRTLSGRLDRFIEANLPVRLKKRLATMKMKKITADLYRDMVTKTILPHLNTGAQFVILLSKPGHYVRLENIEVAGLRIDDPWVRGKHLLVSWKEANNKGYFRALHMFIYSEKTPGKIEGKIERHFPYFFEILKKAAAFFANEPGSGTNSSTR